MKSSAQFLKFRKGCAEAFVIFLNRNSLPKSIHRKSYIGGGGRRQYFSSGLFRQDAYLAQSPQFYKQMMVGVYERVFEIAPVFRAEKHDTARHLNEYTSVDFGNGLY